MINIETKFKIGDSVYFMNSNSIECSKISSIEIKYNSANIYIYYNLCDMPITKSFTENNLYKSLQEILDHLKLEFEVNYL